MAELRDAFLLLDKEPGLTSQQAINQVKKRFSLRKIGHCGTLDSFASGLIVALCGSYTRLAQFITDGDKRYLARVSFGIQTDTLDPGGREVYREEAPSAERLEACLDSFRGEIEQSPPEYSAVHIDGQRAYQKALRGEALKMPLRRVTIHQLTLLSFDGQIAELDVSCSKGTYIRSLARDMAIACGSRAHLASLRRLASSGFSVSAAKIIGMLEESDFHTMGPDESQLAGLPGLILNQVHSRDFCNGRQLRLSDFKPIDSLGLQGITGGNRAVFDESYRLLGVIKVSQTHYSLQMVMGQGNA